MVKAPGGTAIVAGSTALDSKVRELDEHGFEELLAGTDRLIVAEFYMEGCPACLIMVPVMDALAAELAGEAVFARIDARAHLDTALRYAVAATPTFLMFCRGVFMVDLVGVMHPDILRSAIVDMIDHRAKCAGRPITPPYRQEGQE
jgi:thiol-disulfide isomerase/thioredoxin